MHFHDFAFRMGSRGCDNDRDSSFNNETTAWMHLNRISKKFSLPCDASIAELLVFLRRNIRPNPASYIDIYIYI